MALYNWSVQSCCNPSIVKVVRFDPILSAGIIFQDSLNNCYQVVAPTADSPNILLSNGAQLYKTCEECLQFLIPCNPPKEPTTAWLVQSCCDSAITQIVVNNNILPGDIFQDSLGDCYTVLMITEGNPTIVIIDETIYKICEDCITCPPPEPSVTPSITPSPFPTQTITPSITVTPSSTNYNFVSKTPSVTPTATISITPSITPSPGTPECKCITFRNIGDIPRNAFYTTCDGLQNITVQIPRGSSRQYCGGNPTAQSPIQITTGSACVGEECVYPDVSPTPTPTPTVTSVSGSAVDIDDLCMEVVFGSAPSPSATPSITISATPSITVSPSQYPIYPSISPTQTISVTPSITPSITPTKTPSTTVSNTPSITPTRTVTPTISITKTPTVSITPTNTPTPTPSVSRGALVVPECSTLSIDINGNVSSYNSTTNVFTFLFTSGGSPDIAHTTTKLWLYNNGKIQEYNITLSPFTSTLYRTYSIPIGVRLGAGLCAVNDTTLISSNTLDNNRIIKITLNPVPDNTIIIENLFSLPLGRKIAGDFIYTTDNKIILTTESTSGPINSWISQYAIINGVWTLEFDLSITYTAPGPFSLTTINGGIYIFSGNNLKQISITSPYTITQVNNTGNNLVGASQVPSCNNVSFQPNIIPISPTPTSTTTVSLTPTRTVSPSTTPSRTPTPTPTPSPPSNTTPCPGTLPMPGGSVTINGVTLTASGTGCLRLSTSAYASCNTTVPTNTIWAGSNPYCPNSSAFSYTITFSQPVNNISLPITAIGNGVGENISFTTNIGTPTILSNNNCGCIIVGNQIQSTATLNGGGGLFTISAPSSFTTLTISGQGGQNGSFIGINCSSIIPALPADCVSCNILTLPPSGVGAVTNGNLTISTTYSGPALFATSLNSSTCTGANIPSNSPILGASIGAFIYTLNFNQPVNNIKFLLGAGGVTSDPTALETFTFNTSGGTPILSTCGTSCGATINNNVLQLGLVLPYGGGVLTQVKATNSYTQIIITGNGGAAGSIFAICLDTATPLPSPSPSITPSITKSLSVTPSKTATPSISVSTTPSITPTKTATPSITPSASSGFATSCNNILYRTQTSQYYSYNFTTNVSTLLSVAANPNPTLDTSNKVPIILANTSTKSWVYAWDTTTNATVLRESNITLTPFTSTFNRNINLPIGYKPSNGLFALNNTTLIGVNLVSYPANSPQNEAYLVEYNVSGTTAIATIKFKFANFQKPVGGLIYVPGSSPKIIILSRSDSSLNNPLMLYQYDYNTGQLEVRANLSPLNPAYVGLATLNGNLYIMGYNIYKVNTTFPYALTQIQSPGTQLINASQVAGCSNVTLTPSECYGGLPPIDVPNTVTYNGITISASGTGAVTQMWDTGYPTCTNTTTPVGPNSIYLGSKWQAPQTYPTAFVYTMTFSQPVNNLKFIMAAMNNYFGTSESFTFTSNGGNVLISSTNNCYSLISGNTITANQDSSNIAGAGTFLITSQNAFTTLTVTGPGGLGGTNMSVDCATVISAPGISPSPTPTPSISPPCIPCSLPEVTLGTQTWTACNLDVSTYRNGDIIPQVQNPTQWMSLTTGAWCYYDNNPINGCTYGKLYNWYAVNDPRGLAPDGYHIPTEAEINILQQYLGGSSVAGGKLKSTGTLQAGTGLWQSPNTGATNETRWTSLPGGAREGATGGNAISLDGLYWTSSPNSNPSPSFLPFAVYYDTFHSNTLLDLKSYYKTSGYSVRLIKNLNPLGCVYYSANNNTYNYNPITNVSTQVTLPTDTFTSFAETHTSTKYWKGNQTSTIKEWIPTNNPTTLALNRTITVSGITSMFGNYFTFLQAINDTTLLSTIANSQTTPAGNFKNTLIRLDITNNTLTATQITTMFDIYAPAGLDSILLTSTNKLITIGRRNTPTAQNVTYLSQYSYPAGVLEADIDISSTVLATNTQRYLFESNGNLFVSIQFPNPTSTIYSINLNSPYTLTPVYTNMNLLGATFNSSINCNTVNLNTSVPIPSLTPTPTPSPSTSPKAFRTIYKYLDIQ